MEPVVASIRDECTGHHVNIDQVDISLAANRSLIAEHRLVGVPTFLFLDDDGHEVARLIGRQSEDALFQALSALVGDECAGVGEIPEAPVELPCVDDNAEEAACQSTSTSVSPATSSSTTFANTTNVTSRPSAPSATSPASASSPALL